LIPDPACARCSQFDARRMTDKQPAVRSEQRARDARMSCNARSPAAARHAARSFAVECRPPTA